MMIRIGGLIGIVIGLAITFLIFWLAQTFHSIPLKLAMIGPLIAGLSLGLLLFGDGMFKSESEASPSFLGYVFLALGGIAGYFMVEGYKNGNMRWFEKSKVALAEATGLREGTITQEDISAATQAVSARATELQKRRLTLDVNNTAQMEQYNADVAAYTEENRRVRELVTKFEGQKTKEVDLRTKLIGTWRYSYTISQRRKADVEVRGNVDYLATGRVGISGSSISEGKANSFTMAGSWKVDGDMLNVTLDQASGHTLNKPGDVLEFQILSINGTEFRYRDLKDGAELVRYRVQ